MKNSAEARLPMIRMKATMMTKRVRGAVLVGAHYRTVPAWVNP